MDPLITIAAPGALAYGLYLWAENKSKAEFNKYSRSSLRGWNTRRSNQATTGHYLIINDKMTGNTESVWMEN